MRPVFMLCGTLIVFSYVSAFVHAEYSRRLVSRKERNASGQDVYVTETAIEEHDDDGKSTIKEEEVTLKQSGNQKRHLNKREIPHKIECTSMKPPDNGVIKCSLSSDASDESKRVCSANCIQNYKFPDGSAVKKYNCTRKGEFWNRMDQIPDCQPAKEGIGCDKNIRGEKQELNCLTTSEYKYCESICLSGHKFPDGKQMMEIVCSKSTGNYRPIDKFPDCVVEGNTEDKEAS